MSLSTATLVDILDSGLITMTKGDLVATLPSWGYYFEVSLQLWIESWSDGKDGWFELLRFTSTENNCCSAGDRIPALFVNEAGFILASSQVGTNGNFHKSFYIGPKTWTKVLIKQYSENGKV